MAGTPHTTHAIERGDAPTTPLWPPTLWLLTLWPPTLRCGDDPVSLSVRALLLLLLLACDGIGEAAGTNAPVSTDAAAPAAAAPFGRLDGRLGWAPPLLLPLVVVPGGLGRP